MKDVQILRPQITTINLPIRGTSSLIMHKWAEKAKKEMRDKQMKKAPRGKVAKDPQADFEASIYYNELGEYAFPSVAFKAAAVRAGTTLNIKMVDSRQYFFIHGEFVRIEGEPTMREDMVVLNKGPADIRYRAEFKEWSAILPIQINTSVQSEEVVVNLIAAAGFSVGVGEWRPEKNGQHGRWEIDV